jgi:hypothetical protein
MINIITPCSRPENLHKIAASINIPKDQYRWIVIFDMDECSTDLIPTNCLFLYHKDKDSISGNSQRNLAIDLIDDGYVYFLDDDNILHPDLYDHIKDLNDDMIYFHQEMNKKDRLGKPKFEIGHIDTACVVIKSELIGDTKWKLDVYEADYFFIKDIYNKSKSINYIPKILCYYNKLKNGY